MDADGPVEVWPEATKRLLADPAFGPLVARVGPVILRPVREDPFRALARAIIYQQLAGRAAAAIHGRFAQAVGGEVTPHRVLSAPDEALQAAGLSRNKRAALKDLAACCAEGRFLLEELGVLGDEEVVEALTVVRGVGRWTAEMFLLFDLRRPDVWPVGDLGVRAGLGKLLGRGAALAPAEAELVGVGYRPWRSATAWYCWRALDASAS